MVKQRIPFIHNFNWRILLLRILINAVALLLAAALLPSIYFVDRSLATLFLMAFALGVLNAFVKPIIQVLTLRFIFASYGLIVVLINTLMMYLLAFLFPERFAVDKFIWALVGGALIGLVGGLLESLLGVTPPIVADSYPELRAKVREGQAAAIGSRIARPAMTAGLGSASAEGAEAPSEADSAAIPVEESIDAGAQVAAGGEA